MRSRGLRRSISVPVRVARVGSLRSGHQGRVKVAPTARRCRASPPKPVPRVLLVPGALDDLERIQDFLREHQPERAVEALAATLDAVSILQRHPGIGRPVDGTLRELVISCGATGHVALYRVPPSGTVEALGVRHQKEAGYG